MYIMNISTVIKGIFELYLHLCHLLTISSTDISPSNPATYLFSTSYSIPPITGLHAYRNGENSLKVFSNHV